MKIGNPIAKDANLDIVLSCITLPSTMTRRGMVSAIAETDPRVGNLKLQTAIHGADCGTARKSEVTRRTHLR
jgi:hypothetical protein